MSSGGKLVRPTNFQCSLLANEELGTADDSNAQSVRTLCEDLRQAFLLQVQVEVSVIQDYTQGMRASRERAVEMESFAHMRSFQRSRKEKFRASVYSEGLIRDSRKYFNAKGCAILAAGGFGRRNRIVEHGRRRRRSGANR